MDRSIVHTDLDSFFVSCEVRQNSALQGIPLIIGGSSDRAVVASCSYEARKFGIRSAMPLRQAKLLCPQAKVINPDMDYYSKCSSEVTQMLEEVSPIMERASIDEFYIDASGMDKYIGTFKWTSELIAKIHKETHLPMSFGISVNKTVSKIATTECKPKGKLLIPADSVRPFLNPLSIRKIPGLGAERYEELARSGIRIIYDLAEVDREIMHNMFGKDGITIWRKANGLDDSPVQPYIESKSISKSYTFDQDTIDLVKVKSLISSMVEELSYKLREDNWLTSCVNVKIKYSNFDNESKQKKIPFTSLDQTLKNVASVLFDQLYNRRMRIRLVGVSFSGMVHGKYQISLFEDTIEHVNLYNAIDKLRHRHGFKAVMTAQTLQWYSQALK